MAGRFYLVADGGQIAQTEFLFGVADLLEGIVHLEVGEDRKAGIDAAMWDEIPRSFLTKYY